MSSDEFHPVIGFDAEAHDTLDSIIRGFRDYGVTLTIDGEPVEAVISQPVWDEETGRLLVEFYRVVDNDYRSIVSVPENELERAFVTRIQIA